MIVLVVIVLDAFVSAVVIQQFIRFHFKSTLDEGKKKPTWTNTLRVFNHVGLLRNRPPGEPGCLSFSRPTTCIYLSGRIPLILHHSKQTVGP
jgi:hypothetical protein